MMKWTGIIMAAVLLFSVQACRSKAQSKEPKKSDQIMTDSSSAKLAEATFGEGCFWCVEAIYKEIKGVKSVDAGYAGGHVKNPTYEQVCSDTTGYAEVARITYDPSVISYEQLLQVFWHTHNPTTLNRQGADVGKQYRSVIFYHNEKQKEIAEKSKAETEKSGLWDDPIVTEISPLKNYYKAEDYHQDYFAKNPNAGYCSVVIAPKVKKFKKEFSYLLKKQYQ